MAVIENKLELVVSVDLVVNNSDNDEIEIDYSIFVDDLFVVVVVEDKYAVVEDDTFVVVVIDNLFVDVVEDTLVDLLDWWSVDLIADVVMVVELDLLRILQIILMLRLYLH
jgi:hypothetical protein